MIGFSNEFFIGVVEDIADPEKMNRVRVRCFGYHSDSSADLPTDKLPWATVMMPNTSASVEGYGMNHRLLTGSWVTGIFMDEGDLQNPLILGSISSGNAVGKTEGEPFTGKYGNVVGKDLPLEADTSYPDNYVEKTWCGHLVEFDNTENEERINIQHKKDSRFTIDKNGSILATTVDHSISMDNESELIEVKHKSGTTLRIEKDGTVNIDASNDVVNIDGNTTITGTLTVSDSTTLNNTLDVKGSQNNSSTISASGEIKSGSIKLTQHKHDGVKVGGDTSKKPVA